MTTIIVLLVALVSALSIPGFFLLGTLMGHYRMFFYFATLLAVLLSLALSVAVSLTALILDRRSLRLRATYPLAAGLLAAVAWVFSMGHPPDLALERHFSAHEAEFARALRMAEEDAEMVRISYDFTDSKSSSGEWRDCGSGDEGEGCLSYRRWQEYRRLFRSLGLPVGLRHYREHGEVVLPASAFGLVTGGDEVGYAHSEKEPGHLVESLGDLPEGEGVEGPVYKRLDGDWYLYYRHDD